MYLPAGVSGVRVRQGASGQGDDEKADFAFGRRIGTKSPRQKRKTARFRANLIERGNDHWPSIEEISNQVHRNIIPAAMRTPMIGHRSRPYHSPDAAAEVYIKNPKQNGKNGMSMF